MDYGDSETPNPKPPSLGLSGLNRGFKYVQTLLAEKGKRGIMTDTEKRWSNTEKAIVNSPLPAGFLLNPARGHLQLGESGKWAASTQTLAEETASRLLPLNWMKGLRADGLRSPKLSSPCGVSTLVDPFASSQESKNYSMKNLGTRRSSEASGRTVRRVTYKI